MVQKNTGMMRGVRVSLFSNIALFVIKGITFVIVNSPAIASDFGISLIALGVSLFL